MHLIRGCRRCVCVNDTTDRVVQCPQFGDIRCWEADPAQLRKGLSATVVLAGPLVRDLHPPRGVCA
jgi:hypothetical protein